MLFALNAFHALIVPGGWAPDFFEKLRAVDGHTAAAVDKLLNDVSTARRSKQPRRL